MLPSSKKRCLLKTLSQYHLNTRDPWPLLIKFIRNILNDLLHTVEIFSVTDTLILASTWCRLLLQGFMLRSGRVKPELQPLISSKRQIPTPKSLFATAQLYFCTLPIKKHALLNIKLKVKNSKGRLELAPTHL